MKKLLLLLLLPSLALGQNYNEYTIGYQSSVMPLNIPYQNQSLMWGIQSNEGDQFLLGAVYKSFMGNVGHNRNQIGVRAHAHAKMGKIAPYLSYDMMWGEFYQYEDVNSTVATINRSNIGRAELGVGYLISDNLAFFTGYAPKDYNPEAYFKRSKSPYMSGSVVFKLSYNLLLGTGFSPSSIKRRMW